MNGSQSANLFVKTRYSLAEEDRVVNAMSLTLQHLPTQSLIGLFNQLSIPITPNETPVFDDHVAFGPESIVDLVISVPNESIVFAEAKVVPKQFDDPEQAHRYWRILSARSEARRCLLLVSPDSHAPSSVATLRALDPSIRIAWLS